MRGFPRAAHRSQQKEQKVKGLMTCPSMEMLDLYGRNRVNARSVWKEEGQSSSGAVLIFDRHGFGNDIEYQRGDVFCSAVRVSPSLVRIASLPDDIDSEMG